jgi:hypothetical protein
MLLAPRAKKTTLVVDGLTLWLYLSHQANANRGGANEGKTMKALPIAALTLVIAAQPLSAGQVYKCQHDDGLIEYTGLPCGGTSRPVPFNEQATFNVFNRSQNRPSQRTGQVSDYRKTRQNAIAEESVR